MVTYEQIPLIRLHARRAHMRGEMNKNDYLKLLETLDRLEEQNKRKEKINQDKMISTLNRLLTYA